MKAGLIGTGGVAEIHVRALRAIGIEVAAVMNHRLQTAQAFARAQGIPVFSDHLKVFLDPEISTVHICTPPVTHGPLILALMEMRKNIVTEKPFTVADDEAWAIERFARDYPGIHAVNFNLRFYKSIQKARSLIDAGTLGPLRLIHGYYLQAFHILPAPYGWRYDPLLAGPMRAVTEIGSHWLDLSEYLSGQKILKVSALMKSFNPLRRLDKGIMYPPDSPEIDGPLVHVTSEDAAILQMIFEDGTLGSLVLSEVSHGHENDLSIRISGDAGTLNWSSQDHQHLSLALKDTTEHFHFTDNFQSSFEAHFKDIYQAVKRGEKNSGPGFQEGAHITRLANAILKSSQTQGKWVEVL
ncbi:MAG: hypothetical protein AVO33_10095 [delta proteobacterium ML8_F1]|nr:MAG: hypothetical protein AVO33_10095 [delta proteobacterium ML8_F1]